MSERILFLTGKLAEKQLHQVLQKMQPEFTFMVHQIGVTVAALMSVEMIARRLKDTFNADRIILPGRCRGDIKALAKTLAIPVERGPDELKDLPLYFGKQALHIDLSHYDVNIFAEIVNAPELSVEAVVQRAYYYQSNGANIIDIGCLPDTPFPQMENIVRTLKQEGFQVSIDSLATDDLLRGAKAGADYMLSLHESTLWVADEVDAIPIIIAQKHANLNSLHKSIEQLQANNKAFIVDPILDPIHFGFTESVVRYHAVRQKYPDIEMMLGVGNITELTHADTAGMNALLLGICSELNIQHILTTEVSQHASRAIKEADIARRIMSAAKQNNTLPKHINAGLMALHETSPFPYQLAEIKAFAEQVKDPSMRIQISIEGVHIYNRDGLHSAISPFDLYPKLQVEEDASHAFYLGVQLARAEIAWQLGKRFNQDQRLNWGCATKTSEQTVKKP